MKEREKEIAIKIFGNGDLPNLLIKHFKKIKQIRKDNINEFIGKYEKELKEITPMRNWRVWLMIKVKKFKSIMDNIIEKAGSRSEKKCKGSGCSESGNNYEINIWKVAKYCSYNGKPFNTQKIQELGGSSDKNDIECNSINIKDIGIEAKKYNTPDWMQCSLKYNKETDRWEGSTRGKIPKESREIFNSLIQDIHLYEGGVPPFMLNSITHEEWIKIKKETTKWDDHYIDIPPDTIKNIYNAKGCQYIQISDYGLYHLGDDICNFGVPEFIIPQQIRIRTKIHKKIKADGYCNLSVMAACQPKNIKGHHKSPYSLDDISKLPPNLVYQF